MNSFVPVQSDLPILSPVVGESAKNPVQTSAGGICLKCGGSFKKRDPDQNYCPGECQKWGRRKWGREHYARNRERLNAKRKQWTEKNIDKVRQQRRARYAANPKAHMDSHRKWVQKNRETVRAINIAYKRRVLSELKEKCYLLLGNECKSCGEKRRPVLTIDHVRGDGKEHRAKRRTQILVYRDVIADESGRFQLLCMNCQWMKRHENKEFTPRKNRPVSEAV